MIPVASETIEVHEGDELRLGSSKKVMHIVAFTAPKESAKDRQLEMLTQSREILDKLTAGLAAKTLALSHQFLCSECLEESVQAFADLLKELSSPLSTSLVILQEEQHFENLVLVCDHDSCSLVQSPHSMKHTDLLRYNKMVLSQAEENWWLRVPFLSKPPTQKLIAYAELSYSKEPSEEALARTLACASWMRPFLITLLKLDRAKEQVTHLRAENNYFRTRARRHYLLKELVDRSAAMQGLYGELERVIRDSGPALILGEAGSGKKLVARALHHLGEDRDGMFSSQHCGASDLDTELFGVSKDQGRRPIYRGLFELTDGGTIFLDEIDQAPLELQTKLMRLLREHEVRRNGELVGRPVNVRVVAGSHRDLEALAKAGRFRKDLLLALKTNTLTVPPLRERREDLLPMCQHFVEKYSRRYGLGVKGLSNEASERLMGHSWPGNVRELQIVIETAVIKTREGEIQSHHLDLVPR